MGHGGAENGFGTGAQEALGRAPQGCSGGADIINKQHVVAVKATASRKATACEPGALGAGPTRLAVQSVAVKGVDSRPTKVSSHLGREQAGGAGAATEATKTVRRNRGHERNCAVPGSKTEGCREPATERPSELVVPAVLERQDRPAKDAVV